MPARPTSKHIGYLKLAVGSGFYLYDTTTNAVACLPELAFALIDDYLAVGPDAAVRRHAVGASSEEIEEALAFLEHAVSEAGMLQPFFAKRYDGVLDPERLATVLSSGLEGLTLGVTEECNQRCTYCVYSGHYAGERTHQNRHMAEEVAQWSLDFFLPRASTSSGEVDVAFYGGEPLLRWPMVKRCIEYVLGHPARGKNVKLSVSSNLTLMKGEILAFLVEHDVDLAVSLDGPPKIHDSARLLRNGSGTHARVEDWLRRIWRDHPRYFRNNVSINATFDLRNDIRQVFDFFAQDWLLGANAQVSAIRREGNDAYVVSAEQLARHREHLDELVRRHVRSLATGEPFHHDLLRRTLRDTFAVVANRELELAEVDAHPNSTCIPGARRLFVDVQGRFYPCQSLCFEAAAIGDCEHGFDLPSVRGQLETMVGFCADTCQECWANRLCSHCLIHLADAGQLSPSKKRERCEKERARLAKGFERFIELIESVPPELQDHPESIHSLLRRLHGEAPLDEAAE